LAHQLKRKNKGSGTFLRVFPRSPKRGVKKNHARQRGKGEAIQRNVNCRALLNRKKSRPDKDETNSISFGKVRAGVGGSDRLGPQGKR